MLPVLTEGDHFIEIRVNDGRVWVVVGNEDFSDPDRLDG